LKEWGGTLDSVSASEIEELERGLHLIAKVKGSIEELAEALEVRRARLASG
jgi:hypothetical protein